MRSALRQRECLPLLFVRLLICLCCPGMNTVQAQAFNAVGMGLAELGITL